MGHSLTPPAARPHASPRVTSRVARAAAGLALAAAATASAQPRLLAVPEVDLARYAGQWYEVARLPNRFQANCVGDVTATYTPREDGTVGVVNRCRTGDGEHAWDIAKGVARPLDDSNARLRVSFLPEWLRWLPVGWGHYWVLELDPQYRWALVGEPDRRYLWVLSRTPTLPPERLDALLGIAREMGFPVSEVVRSDAVARAAR